MSSVIHNPYRTHAAGALRPEHAGQAVTLSGWAQAIRRFRTQAFIELRETSGYVQLVVPAGLCEGLTEESALRIQGQVVLRRSPHPNPSTYPTGLVEVQVTALEVLGAAGALPFARHESPGEEQVLRHRTLALRWPEHQAPLLARAAIVSALRQTAEAAGCLEVETPILVRPTPGGASPFIVPHAGRQYALAQSPQVWKQLLVCGGIERYYQLAHCFRNEGARPERQPEFSQFEIELAFATAPMVQELMEQMVLAAARACGAALPGPFPRLTYGQAMARYGSDKPHLGNPLQLQGSEVLTLEGRFLQAEVSLPLPRPLTRAEQSTWLKRAWEGVGEWGEVILPLGNHTLVVRGPLEQAQRLLGQLRTEIAESWDLVQPGLYPLWVEQCPMFERSPEGAWVSAHHPFTRPLPGHETGFAEPGAMLAEAFDLVLNGQEIGGGSMRIHEPALQRRVFETLGWPESESQQHFRPLLEALALGAPPHGGMALGVERLVASLLGLPHIRAVMAFPKTTGGQCLLTQALA